MNRIKLVGINLKFSRLTVDGRELTIVARLEIGADVLVVQRIATASKLLFAVSGLNARHEWSPGNRSNFDAAQIVVR